ncbi:uncharacterized protein BCR38DRAFT_72621 [Pseudomassariella vexata]|uniref:Uncharacterized protein n=1 Tax=Pseudomassariella vexata TaxID=1141098 RepID=A0A1Y2DGI7_9PEZI|nr:uncharacterized protein BCR38DRAFT_72621 [Pseudomassariella vexata]ORY58400.1 hypothetical protein BCR38DRAFT_72621 [Pseudomassariella vexata]
MIPQCQFSPASQPALYYTNRSSKPKNLVIDAVCQVIFAISHLTPFHASLRFHFCLVLVHQLLDPSDSTPLQAPPSSCPRRHQLRQANRPGRLLSRRLLGHCRGRLSDHLEDRRLARLRSCLVAVAPWRYRRGVCFREAWWWLCACLSGCVEVDGCEGGIVCYGVCYGRCDEVLFE